MSNRRKILLGVGVILWALVFATKDASGSVAIVFFAALWLLPVVVGGQWYFETKEHSIWKENSWKSLGRRTTAYPFAFLGNLFWPVFLSFPEGVDIQKYRIVTTPLFVVAVFGVWSILLFFRGGPSPTHSEGRLVPLFFSFVAFTTVMFL